MEYFSSLPSMVTSMFGGGFFNMHFQQGGQQQEAPRGHDVTMELAVSLEHLYTGRFVEVWREPCNLIMNIIPFVVVVIGLRFVRFYCSHMVCTDCMLTGSARESSEAASSRHPPLQLPPRNENYHDRAWAFSGTRGCI